MAVFKRVSSESEPSSSALDRYLAEFAGTQTSIGYDEATLSEISNAFEKNVKHTLNRVANFTNSSASSQSILCYGKVQSGKTAHMLGVIAGSVDLNFDVVIFLAGMTDALVQQTTKRLQDDLQKPTGSVKVLEIPVSKTGAMYVDVFQDASLVLKQNINRIHKVLPVFVSLKTNARLGVVSHLIQQLQELLGRDINVLIIDDEADQASQNALAQKREAAKTYKSISKIRKISGRNLYLSYTATPQAVLLTDKLGELRPDFCAMVIPGQGYFGLDELLGDGMRQNLVEVFDVNGDLAELQEAPPSLKESIFAFFASAYIRAKYPDIFYSERLAGLPLGDRMLSTQMLVHESSRQGNHSQVQKLINDFLEEGAFLKFSQSDKFSSLITRAMNMQGLPDSPLTLKQHEKDLAEFIHDVVKSKRVKVKVVNSDPRREDADESLPVKRGEWEVNELWILVGGDILGRGITIPQLTVTYFTRMPKQPNFDTVSQQMRFCGYRADYSRRLFFFAPSRTFSVFAYMRQIEKVIWARASKWDSQDLNLREGFPPIYYASSVQSPLEATRRNVRDPELLDKKISSKANELYSCKEIFNPFFFSMNLNSIRNWLSNPKVLNFAEVSSEYIYLNDLPVSHFTNLLESLNLPKSELPKLRSVLGLFDEAMSEFGLINTPISVLLPIWILSLPGNKTEQFEYILKATSIVRDSILENGDASMTKWKNAFLFGENASTNWPKLRVQHMGGGQRAAIEQHTPRDSDRTVVIFDSINAKVSGSKDVSLGLGITVLKPQNFEVRLMVHA